MRMSLERKAARISPPRWAALHLDSFADVADQDAVERVSPLEQRRQPAEHADAEVVEDAAVGVRLPAELAAAGADVAARQLQGRKEPGKRRRRGHRHRHGRQAHLVLVDFRTNIKR